MKKYKYVVAVSGGPDSMHLLWKYRKKKIIVAHINYNYRGQDSIEDYELVKAFCKKNNIIFEYLDLNDEINEKYKHIKNKQSRSRQIRYDFFKSVMKKYEVEILLIAHNKDDFLETALMQYRRDKNKLKLFYGLEKVSLFDGFEIRRPILDLWKKEIVDFNLEKKIPFRIDKSNNQLIYERNKIRYLLMQKSILQKIDEIDFFQKMNKRNEQKLKNFQEIYSDWKANNFLIPFFNELEYKTKLVLIYWFVNNNSHDQIKLSSGKIESIISYIEAKNGNKKFELNDIFYLTKKQEALILVNTLL